MKKLISVLVSGVIFTSLFTGYAIAQQSTNISFSETKAGNKFSLLTLENVPSNVTTDKLTRAAVKKIKAKLMAARAGFNANADFNKKFRDAAEVKWGVEEKAIVASFIFDDMRSRVVYDKKGNWLYTILNYNADRLPANTRAMIQHAYKDCTITLVQEIFHGDTNLLKVHLKNNAGYKKILIHNDEIIPYQE